ncbi:hypothetical protein [Micromonospora zhanjiangensis]
MSGTRNYIYKLIPPRPTFFVDQTEDERAVMTEHAAYWSEPLAAGTVVVFGPVLDPAGSGVSPWWRRQTRRTSTGSPRATRSSRLDSAPSRPTRCRWPTSGRP